MVGLPDCYNNVLKRAVMFSPWENPAGIFQVLQEVYLVSY